MWLFAPAFGLVVLVILQAHPSLFVALVLSGSPSHIVDQILCECST